MASSPLPCPLIHRLTNAGERERDPGWAIKTKNTWGEAPGRQEKQKHKAEGAVGRGWQERGRDSLREGQNDRQGQGHRPRAKAGERGADVIIIEKKYTVNVICLNHPEAIFPLPVGGKAVFHETGPQCPKAWGLLL